MTHTVQDHIMLTVPQAGRVRMQDGREFTNVLDVMNWHSAEGWEVISIESGFQPSQIAGAPAMPLWVIFMRRPMAESARTNGETKSRIKLPGE